MTWTRRAIPADLRAAMRVARRFHAESPYHSRLRWDDAKVQQLIEHAIEDDDWLALLACNESGIVGIGLFYCLPEFYSSDRVAGDFVFYVVPQARGTRAALLMLNDLKTWAEQSGAVRLQIGVNTGINHDQAVRFFTRRGMVQSGSVLSVDLAG